MKVYKSSKVLILRPEIFSSTLGIFWAIFVFIVTLIAVAGRQTSGDLIDFLKAIYPFYGPYWLGLFLGPIYGFISGFLLGFFIGYIYTWLVGRKVEEVGDPVFNLDPAKDMNVIQKGEGDKPYTIAFVANPVIYLSSYMITKELLGTLNGKIPQEIKTSLASLKDKKVRGKGEFLKLLKATIGEENTWKYMSEIMKHFQTKNGPFELDDLIKDKNLFFKVVIRCLRSFANNELLSLPEIFPRLRLIAIFKNKDHELINENALCEEYDPSVDTLAPRSDVDIITQYLAEFKEDIDVIFLISASERLIRSSAYLTNEDECREDVDGNKGKSFHFTFKSDLTNFDTNRIHAFYPSAPGIVALSAWDDRLKTSVHEFAHAMSSIKNGAIVDEYIDYESATLLEDNIINKRYRNNNNAPVPDLFAKYKPEIGDSNGDVIEYFSDRDRRDKNSDWISYVPERRKPYVSCIMDIAYYGFRFDKLIFDFMYDRLLAKLNRKKPKPETINK